MIESIYISLGIKLFSQDWQHFRVRDIRLIIVMGRLEICVIMVILVSMSSLFLIVSWFWYWRGKLYLVWDCSKNILPSSLRIYVLVLLLRFVIMAQILLKLSLIREVINISRKWSAKWYCFKLDLVAKLIADNKVCLRVNWDE